MLRATSITAAYTVVTTVTAMPIVSPERISERLNPIRDAAANRTNAIE